MVATQWVRITVLDTRDTPFKIFDRFLNPYGEDNGANKGGRHPTTTAFHEFRTELPDPNLASKLMTPLRAAPVPRIKSLAHDIILCSTSHTS